MSKQIGNVQLMQKMNRLRVLNYIRRNPGTSRPVISEHTGLSLASITNITAYLLDIGLVEDIGVEAVERVGRKSTLLRFCSEAYGFVIASLSGEVADVYYTDLEGRVSEHLSSNIASLSSDDVINRVRSMVSSLLKIHGNTQTLAIGINFSGLVLDGMRFVLSSSMKWQAMDIKKIFENDTGLPVFVENISRLRAVGYCSASGGESCGNLLFVDLDNGIGAVQLVGGSVSTNVLGEIGHTTVDKDGAKCFCGNRGCLEAMCSSQRLLSLCSHRRGVETSSVSELMSLYNSGDEAAVFAVRECGSCLGIGLANLVSLFHPSVIAINKGQFAHCLPVIDEAVSHMKKRAYMELWQDVDIRCIDISFNQTIQGAAFEMCNRIFDISFVHSPVQ